MKITKNLLRNLIKEELGEASKSTASFYLVYDDMGMMELPKTFATIEEAEAFVEQSADNYDTHDFVIIPMNYESLLSIKRAGEV